MFRITCAHCERTIEAPSSDALPERCPHCGNYPFLFAPGDIAPFTPEQIDYLRRMGLKIGEA